LQVLRYATFDIGICAHNEAGNIDRLLHLCAGSKVQDYFLEKIIVISSQSTDSTNELVGKFANEDRRIDLVTESTRTGKSSAVNKILKLSNADIVVLISADVLPSKDALDKLLQPFHDPKVGMVGSKIMPVNGYHTISGNIIRFIWNLHDILASVEPKFGEAIAFRKEIVNRLEPSIIADEAFIEMKVKDAGYKMHYAPDSKIFNRGPETMFEFLEQRKRVYAGHLQLKMKYGYSVSSLKPKNLMKTLFIGRKNAQFRYVLAAIVTEGVARAWGTLSFMTGKKDHVWRILKSTKRIL
jgi:poly-beta-1,6-N-acetyl-D-glucosamine synthase